MNKIQICLMISRDVIFMYVKTLLSKHNKYIQEKLLQIIQSRRLKNTFTILEGAFKNIVHWIHSNLQIDLIKYMTVSQVYISDNVIQIINDLVKQKGDTKQDPMLQHTS